MVGRLALVRWMKDESVGVMPLTAIQNKAITPFVGAIVLMKYQKNFYDAEVLKISGLLKSSSVFCFSWYFLFLR